MWLSKGQYKMKQMGILKKLLRFTSLYLLVVVIANFIVAHGYYSLGQGVFPVLLGGRYTYLKLPFSTVGRYTAALPIEMLNNIEVRINYFGIVVNVILFVGSTYLVISKKIKLKTWLLVFIFLCLMVISYYSFLENRVIID